MKRAIVKSVVIALAIMLISVSAFAADVSASVIMTGRLWGNSMYAPAGFVVNNQGQKDADLIQVSISDAMFGASFRLYSSAANDTAVQSRKMNVFVKPISMLKISIGNIAAGLFTEQLNWWMVPNAGTIAPVAPTLNPKGWDSGAAYDDDGGIALELTPIEGLFIALGLAPGYGNGFNVDGDVAEGFQPAIGGNTVWGIVAKYKIGDIGTAGVSYKYEGGVHAGDDIFNDFGQSIRAGMDFTMVPGLYAFLQIITSLEQPTSYDVELGGVTIDNYVAYSVGAFTIKAEFPFTLRLTDIAGDDSYMTFDLKASYKVTDNVTPYLRVRQNGNDCYVGYLAFGDADLVFAPQIDLGANITLGKAAIDTSIRVVLPTDVAGQDLKFAVPFEVRVSW